LKQDGEKSKENSFVPEYINFFIVRHAWLPQCLASPDILPGGVRPAARSASMFADQPLPRTRRTAAATWYLSPTGGSIPFHRSRSATTFSACLFFPHAARFPEADGSAGGLHLLLPLAHS
jgi:hypothetical protein